MSMQSPSEINKQALRKNISIRQLRAVTGLGTACALVVLLFLAWAYTTGADSDAPVLSQVRDYFDVRGSGEAEHILFTQEVGDEADDTEAEAEKERLARFIAEASDEEFKQHIFDIVDRESLMQYMVHAFAFLGQHERDGYLTYNRKTKKFRADPVFDYAVNAASIPEGSRVFGLTADPLMRRLFDDQPFGVSFLHDLSKRINRKAEREELLDRFLQNNAHFSGSDAALISANIERLHAYFNEPLVWYRLERTIEASAPVLDVSVYGLSPVTVEEIRFEFTDTADRIPEYLEIGGDPVCTLDKTQTTGQAVYLCESIMAQPRVEPFVPRLTQEDRFPYTLFRFADQRLRFEFPASSHTDIDAIKEVGVKMTNTYSNENVDHYGGIFVDERQFRYFEDIALSPEEFVRKHSQFRLAADNAIVLGPGAYVFDQTVVIPKQTRLTIEKGTGIYLKNNASFVSYSPVTAVGTAALPISIQGEGDGMGENFAVLNNDGLSVFEYVHMSGGGESAVNGAFFSGMLAVHHADSIIRYSIFEQASGDDALNIKYASSTVAHNVFVRNAADAIDFDVAEGTIEFNRFIDNGDDGIDTSASTVRIQHNHISGSGDKCISVGERSSPVVFNTILDGCRIGVEVKDLSTVAIINTVIMHNEVGINAYQKKDIFGGGRGRVYNSMVWSNKRAVDTDDVSSVDIMYSAVEGGYNGQGNTDQSTGTFTSDISGDILQYQLAGNSHILSQTLNIETDTAPIGLYAAFDLRHPLWKE